MTLTIPGGIPWTVHNAEPGNGHDVARRQATVELDRRRVRAARARRRRSQLRGHGLHMGITSPLGHQRRRPAVPARRRTATSRRPPPSAGSSEGVTPLEMADAYATLADGGVRHRADVDRQGRVPRRQGRQAGRREGHRVLTPGQAYEVTRVLEGVITTRHRRRLHLDRLPLGGRQDRHHRRRVRRLVRRLHAALLDRGVDRAPALARLYRLRRPDLWPDLARLHAGGTGSAVPRLRNPRRDACALAAARRSQSAPASAGDRDGREISVATPM